MLGKQVVKFKGKYIKIVYAHDAAFAGTLIECIPEEAVITLETDKATIMLDISTAMAVICMAQRVISNYTDPNFQSGYHPGAYRK